MKGFREAPKANRLDKLEVENQNAQMAVKLSQMVIQNLMKSQKAMESDLNKLATTVNQLQYKAQALQKLGSFSSNDVNNLMAEMQLKDFNDASDKEDIEKGYTVADTTTENSIVIITSTVNGSTDEGFFRSKIKLSDTAHPELIKQLTGVKVGAKAEVDLNGQKHSIELLGIREEPVKVEEVKEEQKLELVKE